MVSPNFRLASQAQWQQAIKQPWHDQGIVWQQQDQVQLLLRDFHWQISCNTQLSSNDLQARIKQGLALNLALEDALLMAIQPWDTVDDEQIHHGLADLLATQVQDSRDPLPLHCQGVQDMGLYAVMPSIELVHACLDAGLTTVQLRHKGLSPDLEADLSQCQRLAKQYQAQVFVNDSWQQGLEAQVFGLHLGQEDCFTADLPAIAQRGLRLGLSTHGFAELLRAIRLTPSYVALGHVFATQTKDMPSTPQGLERLQQYLWLAKQSGVSCLAIGGIKEQHFNQLAQIGLSSVALVSAISQAEKPKAKAGQLREAWQQAVKQAQS